MNKRKTTSNNASPKTDSIPELPLQIIAEILSRLPAKNLLNLKCVSKSWCSFISTPEFAKSHIKRALLDTNSHRLFLSSYPFQSVDLERCCDDDGNKDTVATHLCYPSRYEDIDAELNILTTEINSRMGMPETDFDFKGSCNGLICALFGQNQFFVFNPTTRESRELPMFPIEEDIIFDGFGYDSQHDDYKLVVGTYGGEVSIFSLKGNSWRTIQGIEVGDQVKRSGTFLNGVLHWLDIFGNDDDETPLLLPFDLAEEKFVNQKPLPDHIDHSNSFRELNVIENCLCVSTPYDASRYEVWIMKEYGNNDSWTKLCSFNSDPLPGSKYYLQLQWVTKNGNVVFNRDGWYLVVCDPKNGSVKQIWIPSDWDWCMSIMYLESLVSPNQ